VSLDNRGGNVNVVTLIGNLATDVELREVGEGKRVASFVLAVDRPKKDGGADFVRVAVWDRQGELCGQFLAKGKRVGLDGRLRSRSWQDSEGNRRSAVEVVANRVQFLSPREEGAGTEMPFEAAAFS
jgi:single-strand DNA-binding protein